MTANYKKSDSDTRPWGTWEVLDAGDTYAVKKITVLPEKSSLCKAITIATNIGSSSAEPQKSESATKPSSPMQTRPFLFRQKHCTASKTPAKLPWSLSKCRPANFWMKTISFDTKTLTDASKP